MTQPDPIQDVFRLFSELLDEVESLLGEEKGR
jgi:hypothetical protein